MKYMLLMYGAEREWTEAERRDCMLESMGISDELDARGSLVAAAPLQPVSTATSVRVREGRRQVTDGPFAETTEQLGGYYIIDVENLDQAIAIAARLPPASKGTVEIRPQTSLGNNRTTALSERKGRPFCLGGSARATICAEAPAGSHDPGASGTGAPATRPGGPRRGRSRQCRPSRCGPGRSRCTRH
jgi:hypothetical protein